MSKLRCRAKPARDAQPGRIPAREYARCETGWAGSGEAGQDLPLVEIDHARLVRSNLVDVDVIVPGVGVRLDLLDVLLGVGENGPSDTRRYVAP